MAEKRLLGHNGELSEMDPLPTPQFGQAFDWHFYGNISVPSAVI